MEQNTGCQALTALIYQINFVLKQVISENCNPWSGTIGGKSLFEVIIGVLTFNFDWGQETLYIFPPFSKKIKLTIFATLFEVHFFFYQKHACVTTGLHCGPPFSHLGCLLDREGTSFADPILWIGRSAQNSNIIKNINKLYANIIKLAIKRASAKKNQILKK